MEKKPVSHYSNKTHSYTSKSCAVETNIPLQQPSAQICICIRIHDIQVLRVSLQHWVTVQPMLSPELGALDRMLGCVEQGNPFTIPRRGGVDYDQAVADYEKFQFYRKTRKTNMRWGGSMGGELCALSQNFPVQCRRQVQRVLVAHQRTLSLSLSDTGDFICLSQVS